MGKSQRDKGYRTENNLRNLLIDAGITCRRVPLSGVVDGYQGDLIITNAGQERRAEVKCRGNGFRQVYGWLEGNDMLFLKADRQEYLAVMRLDDFVNLLGRGRG